MYLTTLDLVALVIALGTAITLIATTAIANAKLTKNRDYWFYKYKIEEGERSGFASVEETEAYFKSIGIGRDWYDADGN